MEGNDDRMESIAEAPLTAQVTPGLLPRFQDGAVNLQELLRQLAESIVNEIMDAEADQMCGEGNSRNGYRDRVGNVGVSARARRLDRWPK